MPKYLAALAAALVVVACGGGDGSTTPKPATVASVTMSQPTASMDVGATLALTATPRDGSGNTLTGRTTTWTSSNSNVASVSSGSVTAVAVGSATITATIEGKTATTEITVHLAPVATVTVTPSPKTIIVSGVAQLTATLKDANGNTLTGRTVTWSSSDETKVTVSATGVVTGVALGTVTITATSETKTGTATVIVSDGTFPLIETITPDTLAPGVTGTITGSGFSPNLAENTVTVSGVPVFVIAGSATQLTIVLPTTFPCQTTQLVTVVVTTPNGSGSAQKPLRVAIARALTVGQSMVLTDWASVGCNELSQTGGRYLLSVYSTSTVPSATSQFELKGSSVPSASPSIAATVTQPALRTTRPSYGLGSVLGSELRAKLDRDVQARRQREKMMDYDRALIRRLGSPLRSRRGGAKSRASASTVNASVAGGAGLSASSAPVPTTVGAMTSLRIRSAADTDCTQYNSVRARVVYVGTKSIVLEDSIGALARTLDSDLTSLGQDFESTMYQILTQNFGDPLKLDSETDNNGRVLMLFTPQVNARGLLGFVVACDFFPPADLPSSNQAEIFYASVPETQTGSFLNPRTLPGWRAWIRGTTIHESKHLTAYAEKLSDPTAETLEESWLEEGTAQLAIELYARTKYPGVSWKSNASYENTVHCDFHPTAGGACNHGQFLMGDHFLEVYFYYQANETKSYLSPGRVDGTIYGSAWEFARWVTDQYGATEGGLLKSIVSETHITGVENVENKTGHLYPELNGYFTLSLLADDYPGFSAPNGAKYSFPSWNVPDIFAGIATERLTAGGTMIDDPTPLITHAVSFGSFDVLVPALAGGSGSLFDLTGAQSGKQLVELRAGAAPLPASSPLRLAILRVQ